MIAIEDIDAVTGADHIQVSVCMITYGHQDYIVQAIEGVLQQRFNGAIELVISDDHSPDGTREICRRYQAENPDRIRLLLPERNIGMMPNFLQALGKCRGKYIALCEGDDYWTDPLKLQRQVDYLEANPEYAICFHRAMLDVNGKLEKDTITEPRFDKVKERPISIKSLLEHGNFIHTPTVMFRNPRRPYPMEFMSATMADYLLHVVNSQGGEIHRLEEVMAVYRVGVGVFSSKSPVDMLLAVVSNQARVLSLLTEADHCGIALARFDHSLKSYKKALERKTLEDATILDRLSGRDLIRLLFKKVWPNK